MPKTAGRKSKQIFENRNRLVVLRRRVSDIIGLSGRVFFVCAESIRVVESASFHSQILTSTPFVISNDGNFSIYDVKYTCRILFAHFTNHRQLENASYHYRTFDKLELRAGDKDNVLVLWLWGLNLRLQWN